MKVAINNPGSKLAAQSVGGHRVLLRSAQVLALGARSRVGRMVRTDD